MSKKVVVSTVLLALSVGVGVAVSASPPLTDKEQLGKDIFFDMSLSLNGNQSCATCHGPGAGWTGPDADINAHGAVYEGSISDAFGDRKPPSSAYATQSPILHVDKKGVFVGGNFWDGRATGERLGSPAAEQALGPFLNPKEQALPSAAEVVTRVCASGYKDLFTEVWGDAMCDPVNADTAYDNIGYSIAAYEASPEVNAFTAKYDWSMQGKAKLTQLERRGFALFQGKGKCQRGPGAAVHRLHLRQPRHPEESGEPGHDRELKLGGPRSGRVPGESAGLCRLCGRQHGQAQGADAAQRRPAAFSR